jgi:hypothetical protein
MAGATRTAYSNGSQAPETVAGRSRHPVAGAGAVLAHRDALTEVPPWMYGLRAAGPLDLLTCAVAGPER